MPFDRDEFYKEVGLRIQIARKRRGLTQGDVAEGLGVPRATYANVESGRQRVSLDIIWKIAAVFGVDIGTLVPEPIEASRAAISEVDASISGTALITLAAPAKE